MTKDQIAEAKKAELQTFAERGVYEVVDGSEAELNPESVMLSAERVITNKGTVECSKPKARLVARECVSDAIDRDTLRSSEKKFKIMLLDVTAAFLCGSSERPLFMEIPKENLASEDPRLLARLVRSLNGTRDARQLWNSSRTWVPRDQGAPRGSGVRVLELYWACTLTSW